MEDGLVDTIKALYDGSSSEVLFNNQVPVGELVPMTVGVLEGCMLYPMLLNTFLEMILCDILEHQHTSMRVGGRPLTNHLFADNLATRPDRQAQLQ